MFESWNSLTGERQRSWSIAARNGDLPGFADFVRVCGTDDDQVGDRTQGSEMLDWLVSWAVFGESHRVMGKENDEVGGGRNQGVDDLSIGGARCHALCIGGKGWQLSIPTIGNLPAQPAGQL